MCDQMSVKPMFTDEQTRALQPSRCQLSNGLHYKIVLATKTAVSRGPARRSNLHACLSIANAIYISRSLLGSVVLIRGFLWII